MNQARRIAILPLILALQTARAVALPAPLPCGNGCGGCWVPSPVTSWQWQLQGTIDQSVDVALYDIDLFDVSADVVGALHAAGRHVVCYLDAGTWENWRPDAGQYPSEVLGHSNGWPGEKWLDIRRLDVLTPLLRTRLDLCRSKGFDGVEFDNVDGYANTTGFPLTADDQLTFNVWLANEAHARHLNAALKNDLDQVSTLLPYFDWALDEQCFQYQECAQLLPFVQAGKAVMEVEYSLKTGRFCAQANTLNFNAMKKNLALDVPRTPCR